MNRLQFIAQLAPIVQVVRLEGSCMFPSVRLAQNILETGCKIPAWNNLGGYKVGSGAPTPYWDGSSVSTATREVYNGITVNTTANWRAYSSIYNYYKDQDLLFMKSRYARVRAATTPEDQARALHDCGYATDPAYAAKLVTIMTSNNLIQYDVEPNKEDDEEMTAKEKAAFAALTARVVELEKQLNVTGNQEPPVWAHEAIAAAKQTGIISTSNDKGHSEIVMIQMLYNAGLCNPELITFFKAFRPETHVADQEV